MKYSASYAARVRDLCYLGATRAEIAELLGVSISLLETWRKEYPEFDYAWREGAMHADMKVAGALFKRATGYEAKTYKEVENAEGEITKTRETKHIAPDVSACIFWLTNRRPDLWQQKVEHNVKGNGVIDITDMTEMEQARRIAFALARAVMPKVGDKTRTIDHDDASNSTPTPDE